MRLLRTLSLLSGYAGYYLRATNRHGLQGPFAYALYEAVLRRDTRGPETRPVEELRRALLKDQRQIRVTDFGAGFGGVKYNLRSIAWIARQSAKPPRYARLLHRLVQYRQPSTLLELGTSLGLSALYQSLGAPGSKLYTLEGCPETAAVAREHFRLFPQCNIELTEGLFDETLPRVLQRCGPLDYVYIDGHHRLEPTLRYVELILPVLSDDAVVVIDDINWSDEMREAWQRLKADSRFTQSMDVHLMGWLFNSGALSKEDFLIRY